MAVDSPIQIDVCEELTSPSQERENEACLQGKFDGKFGQE